jgi:hypothetical protein
LDVHGAAVVAGLDAGCKPGEGYAGASYRAAGGDSRAMADFHAGRGAVVQGEV